MEENNTFLIHLNDYNDLHTIDFKLPVIILAESGGTYNFDVFWGDGNNNTITSWNQPQILHTYASPGDYTVSITGTVTGWRFNNGGGNGIDKSKILNISQWGPLNLGNANGYFYGCNNLSLSLTTGTLDLNGTKDMSYAFAGCSGLTTAPTMNSWNFSGVTATTKMFSGATLFNENIGSWNTSNVKDMSYMFYFARAFNNQSNSSIGLWNVSNVRNMGSLFEEARLFNQSIDSWERTTPDVSTLLNVNIISILSS